MQRGTCGVFTDVSVCVNACALVIWQEEEEGKKKERK